MKSSALTPGELPNLEPKLCYSQQTDEGLIVKVLLILYRGPHTTNDLNG